MIINIYDVPTENQEVVPQALELIDRMVWGGTMKQHIVEINVVKNGIGADDDPYLYKGLRDSYDPATKICRLQVGGLISQGKDDAGNLFWSICHDMTHAFDIAMGNLSFDLEKKTLTYIGIEYVMRTKAEINDDVRRQNLFRDSNYYTAHFLYEPWEVKPLLIADLCSNIRRSEKNPSMNALHHLPIGKRTGDVPLLTASEPFAKESKLKRKKVS